uniref:Uncharacterized protein n=1 Tax=Fagus sylvatica TaxID=28930 RepID=A0A2N9H512_FAGSY
MSLLATAPALCHAAVTHQLPLLSRDATKPAENLRKIIQDQTNASQKKTNDSKASHTRDNSVEPSILSASIEVQDLQVPTYVTSTFVHEEELIVKPTQQVFVEAQLDEVDKIGLANLESLNLSFTVVEDVGLRKLSGLSSLKSLNLDVRQITDNGLAALTSLTGLTHLDLFGARITDAGTNHLRSLTGLVSLNVSNSRITSAGLRHLKTLKNLKSLTLEGCKVMANDIKRLQSTDLPNLVSFRPE